MTDYEVNHKRVLIEKILSLRPCKYSLYDEVRLECEKGRIAMLIDLMLSDRPYQTA